MTSYRAAAGIDIGFRRGRPSVGPGISVAERGVRPLGAMAPVAAVPVPAGSRRIQYWMLNGVLRDADAGRADPRLAYDFTFIPDRPIGWERPKTFGHAHARPAPGAIGLAEVIEIVGGRAGFLVQDLLPGPRSTFAALIETGPGDRIILPPLLSHATVSLAGDPVVFTDVIDRRIISGELPSDYDRVRQAHGLAWYIDVDGNARANPAYRDVPDIKRFTAEEWSGPSPDWTLYSDYVERPETLDWLLDPGLFAARFPRLWARVAGVIEAMEHAGA